MPDLSAIKKKAILEQVLDASVIKNKQKYCDLLIYLVECSIKNESPKAISVAVDVFKRSINNLDSSFVRVYIHNLREKLDIYYSTEGKDQPYRIVIPKGHYDIRFEENQRRRGKIFQSINQYREWIWLAIACTLALILLFNPDIVRIQSQSPFKASSIWSDILVSPKPLVINMGDEFFYKEYFDHYDDVLIVKNSQINTKKKMREKMQSDPENKIIQWVESAYFADNCVYGLINLLPFIAREGVNYTCNESDNLNMDYFVNNNIIFIGGHRTLYLLNDFIENSSLGIQIYPEFKVKVDTGIHSSWIHFEYNESEFSKQYDDYCMVLKLPGPRDNHLMVFTSYSGIGVQAVTKYLTDSNYLKEFEQIIKNENGCMAQFFIAVFKVTGVGRYNCDIDIEYFRAVDSQKNIWK
ncbi:hypothetical protein KAR48_16865 [bacterium]|nr:hypothetical protein [bacterium]